MTDPKVCNHAVDGDVFDSRPTIVAGFPAIRRRRKCLACGFRWTTFELSENDLNDLRKAGERWVRTYKAISKMMADSGEDPKASLSAGLNHE